MDVFTLPYVWWFDGQWMLRVMGTWILKFGFLKILIDFAWRGNYGKWSCFTDFYLSKAVPLGRSFIWTSRLIVLELLNVFPPHYFKFKMLFQLNQVFSLHYFIKVSVKRLSMQFFLYFFFTWPLTSVILIWQGRHFHFRWWCCLNPVYLWFQNIIMCSNIARTQPSRNLDENESSHWLIITL